MASVVSICNLALTNIGKPDIQSIDEPSAGAKACKQFYEQVRDTLLQSYPWKFAGVTSALAEITNAKPVRWAHAYKRPVSCLKVRSLNDDAKYAIEAEVIFADVSPAYLEFTGREADPTKYPPLFVEALSWHLAVRLAMPLTGDPKVRADAYQLALQMQGAAEVSDANEVREFDDAPSRAIEAR